MRSSAWGAQITTSNNWISGYINDALIVDSNVSYGAGVGINNTDSALVPVKAGDVFKYVIRAEGNNAKSCTCVLYPYEALPEEEET